MTESNLDEGASKMEAAIAKLLKIESEIKDLQSLAAETKSEIGEIECQYRILDTGKGIFYVDGKFYDLDILQDDCEFYSLEPTNHAIFFRNKAGAR